MSSLQAVMAARMFDDAKLRARFEKACKRPDDKPLSAWSTDGRRRARALGVLGFEDTTPKAKSAKSSSNTKTKKK